MKSISNQRVLILGATGMLGHKLMQILPKNESFEVVGTVRQMPPPDLQKFFPQNAKIYSGYEAEKEERFYRLIDEIQPTAVINCIGIVKQNAQAKNSISSIRINSLFPHLIAAHCLKNQARFFHVSTDCVFTGHKGQPYLEMDSSDADDLYGKSKFLGEVPDQPNTLTLRTSIIGREIAHPTGLLDWFLSQKGRSIQGYSRALFSGLTTNLAAEVLSMLILHHPELSGLYHVATEGISKFDLLKLVNEVYKTKTEIGEQKEFFCDRRLNCDRFFKATGWKAAPWEKLIQQMYEQDLHLYR